MNRYRTLFNILFAGIVILTSTMTSAAPQSKNNWFGGSSYQGEPALSVTSALINAGGGAASFDFKTALVSMLGEETVNQEISKLIEQYGKEDVETFVSGMTYAVKSGINHAIKLDVALPSPPPELKGVALAEALIKAGTDEDGVWWSGLLFDKALSHKIHILVMSDIESGPGYEVDSLTHKILNQAMYDVAQALGHEGVKLAIHH